MLLENMFDSPQDLRCVESGVRMIGDDAGSVRVTVRA